MTASRGLRSSPVSGPERDATILHDREQLRAATVRLGRELTEAYRRATDGGTSIAAAAATAATRASDARAGRALVLVAVLKGSTFFLADLVRNVSSPCEVDFLGISSYAAGTGRVRITKDLDQDIAGRDVVLVEDIVDTGLTCTYVLGELRRRGPASLEVCTLFDRRARRIVPVPLRFVGFEVADDLLLGYGLDVAGRYRNLPFVAAGDRRRLDSDPDAYVADLYGR